MGRASQEALPSRRPIFNLIGSLEGWYPTPTLTIRASRESRLASRAPLFYFPTPFFISPGGIFFSCPPFLRPARAPPPPRVAAAPTPNPRVSIPIPTLGIINDRDARVTGRGPVIHGDIFSRPPFLFSRGGFFISTPFFLPGGAFFTTPAPFSRDAWGAFQRGYRPNFSPISLDQEEN